MKARKLRQADAARLRGPQKPEPVVTPIRSHPVHSCLSCGYEIMPAQPETMIRDKGGPRYMHESPEDCMAGARSRAYYGGRSPRIDASDNWPSDVITEQPRCSL